MNLISANSCLFTQAELRLSTLMRECTAIIYTLTEYEFLILGSKHPTVLFTDHISIIFFFTQKSNPNHRVYRIYLILMKFQNLHIVWTVGKILHYQIRLAGIHHLNYLHEKIQLNYEKLQVFNLHGPLDTIPLSKLEVEKIFLSPTKTITLQLLQKYQNLEPVIRQLKSWHKYKTKQAKADATILGNKTFLRYFRKFNKTTIHESTDLLEYQTPDFKVPCFPLSMMLIAFNISHTQHTKGHSGSDKTYSNFTQNSYFPNAPIWIKVLCNDCMICQLKKPYSNQKQLAPKQDFKGQFLFFNHRTSFDTKGPILRRKFLYYGHC